MTITAARKRFAEMREHAAFSVGTKVWMKAVRAIAGPDATPDQWLDAAEAATVPCEKCHGTGTYNWGGTMNGKPVHSGECYRCEAKGYQDADDMARNHIHTLYAISNAFNV